MGTSDDKVKAIQEKLDLDDKHSSGEIIKQKRDNGDFSLTGYNTRDKIKHKNKLNTESVLCSSNVCVLCYFKIILHPRRNQLMMEANQKVQEINVN